MVPRGIILWLRRETAHANLADASWCAQCPPGPPPGPRTKGEKGKAAGEPPSALERALESRLEWEGAALEQLIAGRLIPQRRSADANGTRAAISRAPGAPVAAAAAATPATPARLCRHFLRRPSRSILPFCYAILYILLFRS